MLQDNRLQYYNLAVLNEYGQQTDHSWKNFWPDTDGESEEERSQNESSTTEDDDSGDTDFDSMDEEEEEEDWDELDDVWMSDAQE